uniref:t-SNARE coiled-coil homology domain-containing protein n=1 Tax=Ananas comosus var. bracteatus TaxID=296719 RepID=A0A6V7QXY7_ANACO
MATRNRTPLYRKYRDALRSVRVPSASSSSRRGPSTSASGGGAAVEMVSTSLLHPNRSYTPLSTEDPGNSSVMCGLFVSVKATYHWSTSSLGRCIGRNICKYTKCTKKLVELVKVHEKALMPSFGDGKKEQRAIEMLTREITDLLKKSEKRLMKLSSTVPCEDSNVRKNVQRSLATDLQNLSMEFRKKQSTYLKRLQQQKEGQDGVDLEIKINGARSTSEDDDFADGGFDDHQLSQLKKSEVFTKEREKEITQIVESVNELAQIMKDLSVLVIDQGTIIDRIDYNIQNVAATVEEGYKQLQKAERTQKKGGMVTCATVLVIMCFVMLVLLILKEILF